MNDRFHLHRRTVTPETSTSMTSRNVEVRFAGGTDAIYKLRTCSECLSFAGANGVLADNRPLSQRVTSNCPSCQAIISMGG